MKKIIDLHGNGKIPGMKKIIKIMKLTCFLILVSVMSVLAGKSYSQTKLLNLNMKKVTVKEVLLEIEKQSEFRFMYSEKFIDISNEVSINVDNEKIETVLDLLFSETNVGYKIKDRFIVLTTPGLINYGVEAVFQQLIVSGKVTDKGGMPLPGVTIVVKGTTTGTVTNGDGEYTLANIPSDAILQFSFVGMKTQEISVEGKTGINVVMEENIIGIEEVVAIGYGFQGKKSLTGAIEDVSLEPIRKRSNSNFIVNLQGSVPGLVVTRKQGDPGNEKADFQIRGISSINTTNPLLVIDDIPYDDHGVLATINPADIAQFSVLKDAAAASLYGARAAGGVILITTKKGRKGKVRVSYIGKVSADYLGLESTPTTQAQYYMMFNEANNLDGITNHRFKFGEQYWLNGKEGVSESPFFDSVDFSYADRDFVSEMWKRFALSHSHQMNISGGTENNIFNISLGYLNAEGLQAPAKNDYERINVRLNYDFRFSKKLKASTSVYIENGVKDKPTLQDAVFQNNNDIYWYTFPTLAYKNPDGKNYGFGGTTDPIAMLELGGRMISTNNKLNTRAMLTYDIMEGLSLNTLMGINTTRYLTEKNTNIVTYWYWTGDIINKQNPSRNQTQKDYSQRIFQNYSAYLNYNKTINNQHNITALVGASYEKDKYTSFSAWRRDLLTEELSSLQLGDPNEQYNTSQTNSWALGSFFGRFNYNYKSKYLCELTARRDGSSRFIADKRWDNFGGVSVGWNIVEEDFFKVNNIDGLKIRMSYGVVGNQSSIGLYDYVQTINANSGIYPFGASQQKNITASLGSLSSESRTWERIETANVGLDIGLFGDKLSGSFDYFRKWNKNMLVGITLPTLLGATPPTGNFGELESHGWEASLAWSDKKGELAYNFKLGISDNTNKIISLAGSDVVSAGQIGAIEGYPLNSMFGYTREGLIKSQEELDAYSQIVGVPGNLRIGDVKFADLNNDGKISVYDDQNNLADVKYLGSNNLRYNIFFNSSFTWKNFDFSAYFSGWLKDDMIRTGISSAPFTHWWHNQNSYFFENTYHPELRPDKDEYPALSVNNSVRNWNYRYADWRVIDNSFIRLKNVNFGYTLPSNISGKMNIELIRVFFSGDDLFEFSNAPKDGKDPERPYNWPGGVPFMRKITFGVDVNF